MTHTAFGKPKIVQGHCSFHPAVEVTDDGAKAIPEISETTSKICMRLCRSPSSSCTAGPAQHPCGPRTPQHVPSRRGPPRCHPWSQQGRARTSSGAYRNLHTFRRLNVISQPCSLCTQSTRFRITFRMRSFQD